MSRSTGTRHQEAAGERQEARYQSLEDAQFDLEPIILDLRKENVGELLTEARSLIAADQFEQAQSSVRRGDGDRSRQPHRTGIAGFPATADQRSRSQAADRRAGHAGREQLGVRQIRRSYTNFSGHCG